MTVYQRNAADIPFTWHHIFTIYLEVFWSFENLNFGFVSDFGFRASNFHSIILAAQPPPGANFIVNF
jgi:hypothetical protein